MTKENKYLNEKEEMYKIQLKDLKGKWAKDKPDSSYSKKDAEMIIKSYVRNGRNPKNIRMVPESTENKLDILDKIEIEQMIRETRELMEDEELSEKALEAAGWGKSSVEKFGKTIGIQPTEHGFMDKCIMRMKSKKGFDKEGAQKFCASVLDKYKGNTNWRGGHE